MKDVRKSLIPALPLLELPANKLLDQFGGGSHVPGSGSAAALMGLLAAQLAHRLQNYFRKSWSASWRVGLFG